VGQLIGRKGTQEVAQGHKSSKTVGVVHSGRKQSGALRPC
jgi:hypothetical protein